MKVDRPQEDLSDPEGRAIRAFHDRFGGQPDVVVQAPGRVNLIGEHTDYNAGLVLPMAIDRRIVIAARATDDDQVKATSGGHDDLDLDLRGFVGRGRRPAASGWELYVGSAASGVSNHHPSFRQETSLGWEGVVASSIPTGASLSSSAALLVATDRLFAHIAGLQWEPVAAAKRAQRVENDIVGVKTGIMDQLASACGRAGHALSIDCADNSITYVPMPSNIAVIVLDTGTRRELTSSDYNLRGQECQAAAAACGVAVLRQLDDFSPDEIESVTARLDDTLQRRLRHVISENHRTRLMVAALEMGDTTRVGSLLSESHASLRDDFEVSSRALNAIVEAAESAPGIIGARMTGAGFGGCALALVHQQQVQEFMDTTVEAYELATNNLASVYECRAADGAGIRILNQL